MPAKKDLNLLPGREWEKTRAGQFVVWALSAGRYIVIATEIIVILAFLFRFKLDRDLTNLNEEIRQKQALIAAAADFEKDFRSFQRRLEIVQRIEAISPHTASLLDDLAALAPNEVYISTFNLAEGEISFEAVALSEEAMGSFLASLQAYPRLESIELTRVATGGEGRIGITFSVSAILLGKEE